MGPHTPRITLGKPNGRGDPSLPLWIDESDSMNDDSTRIPDLDVQLAPEASAIADRENERGKEGKNARRQISKTIAWPTLT